LLQATCHFFLQKKRWRHPSQKRKEKEKPGMQAYLCKSKHVAFLFNWQSMLAHPDPDAIFLFGLQISSLLDLNLD